MCHNRFVFSNILIWGVFIGSSAHRLLRVSPIQRKTPFSDMAHVYVQTTHSNNAFIKANYQSLMLFFNQTKNKREI